MIMTLSDLLAMFDEQDPDLPLVFRTADGDIGAGYHVTELRHLNCKGIDCGGRISSWDEARLQLLDGNGTNHMRVGKFSAIVKQSIAALPELAKADLLIEFGHNNNGLALMSIKKPMVHADALVAPLNNAQAFCKPARERQLAGAEPTICCGSVQTAKRQKSCCVADDQKTACCD
ncbi:MAG: DUF6428 family protein [Paracoccaceae bacterium]